MARKAIHDADALLLYRVGPVYCCAPTLTVESVIMPPHLTHPPGSTTAEPGVFKTAQGIVKAVDLRKRFGVDKEDWLNPGRIIIIEVKGGFAGLWVDDIVDVIQFPQKGWAEVPAGIPKNVFSRTLMLNNVVQLYADFEKIYNFKETGYLRRHIENIKSQISKEEKSSNTKDEAGINYSVDKTSDQTSEDIHVLDNDNDVEAELILNQGLLKSSEKSKLEDGADISHKKITSECLSRQDKKEKFNKFFEIESQSDFEINKENSFSCQHEVIGAIKENIGEVKGELIKSNIKINEENHGPLVLFVIMTAAIFAGFYLLLEMAPDSKDGSIDEAINEQIDSARLVEELPVVKESVEYVLSQSIRNEKKANDVSEDNNSFHADIKEDEEGLVIVLTQSGYVYDSVLALKVTGEKESSFEQGERDTAYSDDKLRLLESHVSTESEIKKSENKTRIIKETKQSNEKVLKSIVHVVVKGDTLWHIAKRYINNPYRYPELARLSEIKNPDLIYPGNKVKIIFKKR